MLHPVLSCAFTISIINKKVRLQLWNSLPLRFAVNHRIAFIGRRFCAFNASRCREYCCCCKLGL